MDKKKIEPYNPSDESIERFVKLIEPYVEIREKEIIKIFMKFLNRKYNKEHVTEDDLKDFLTVNFKKINTFK